MGMMVAFPLHHRKFDEYTDLLTELEVNGCPAEFPVIKENEAVICGSEYTSVENTEGLFHCLNLDSMQETYNRLHLLLKSTLRWYICTDFPELINRLRTAIDQENRNSQ